MGDKDDDVVCGRRKKRGEMACLSISWLPGQGMKLASAT